METLALTALRQTQYPNQLWLVDHHLLDILVVEPQTGGVLRRPWLTVVMDDFSGAICGLHLGLEPPSGCSVNLALRQAMLPKSHPKWSMHGIPDFLLMDHATETQNKRLAVLCQQLGITLLHTVVGQPAAVGKIERFFRVLKHEMHNHPTRRTRHHPSE